MRGKNKSKKDAGHLVRCLRCHRKSRVILVAKCKYCGSYAVKLITKDKE